MSGKVLDQSVFHGAPDWVRFATVTSTGAVVHWEDEPFDDQGAWNVENLDSRYYVLAKHAYGYSNWQQSKIKRQKWLDNFPVAVMTDYAAMSSFASALLEKRNFDELHHGSFTPCCPDKEPSAKEKIALALNKHKKPVLCVVDNGGSKSIAFVVSIGVASGNYIDSFYGSWVNAEPVEAEFEFTVVGRGVV